MSFKRGTDYIGVGVGAILVNQNHEIFLAKHGPLSKNERNLWELPGGSVEFGETLAQALRREMFEEFGVEILVGPLLDVADHHILPEENQHWASPTFICAIRSGKPQIMEPGKCCEIRWFTPEETPTNLTKITLTNLAHYLKYLKGGRTAYSEGTPLF